MRTSDAEALWGFVCCGIHTPEFTVVEKNLYITRTSRLSLYAPVARKLWGGTVSVVFDLELDVAHDAPLHVELDPKLAHLGLRLVHPHYLAPGTQKMCLLLDVVDGDVRVGRGQCVVVLDTRNTRQKFCINAGGLYKD